MSVRAWLSGALVGLSVVVTPLTVAGPAESASPGPDGDIAVLEATQDSNCAQGVVLRTLHADGTSPTTIASVGGAYGVEWSPDGTRIAYGDGTDIHLVDADGAHDTVLATGKHPTWSPDGTQVAYDGVVNQTGVILRKPVAGGTAVQVEPLDKTTPFATGTTADGLTWKAYAVSDSQPAWSPVANRIVFSRQATVQFYNGSDVNVATDEHQDLYSTNADGTDLEQITGDDAVRDDRTQQSHLDQLPTWSPDGATIAFGYDRPDAAPDYYGQEIGLVSGSGGPTSLGPVVYYPRNQRFVYPTYSPQGELAYAANEDDGAAAQGPAYGVYLGPQAIYAAPHGICGISWGRATVAGSLTIAQVLTDPTSVGPSSPVDVRVQLRNDTDAEVTGITTTVTASPDTVITTTGSTTPASVDLAPGDTAWVVEHAMTHGAGTAMLTVSAEGTSGGSPISAATRTRTFPVGGSVSAVLAGPEEDPQPGDTFPVTLSVTNTSGVTQLVTPAALTGVPSTGFQAAPASPAVATLADGDTRQFTYQVSTTQAGELDLATDVTAHAVVAGTDQVLHVTATVTVSPPGIVVTTTGDQDLPAAELTAKVCDVDPATAGRQCTLRAAITLVDALGGVQSIDFDIPGSGVPHIAPATALPDVTVGATIDGTTQPGGWVELSGPGATLTGLALAGPASTVRGLVVNGWLVGISVTGGSGTTISGDRIGTNPAGTGAVPNGNGIEVHVPGTTIGGTAGTSATSCAGDCDLISGNTGGGDLGFGVLVGAGGSATVVGDYLGTDVSGTHALSNDRGVVVRSASASATVGGPTAVPGRAPGNLISANQLFDVSVNDGSASVVGNLIGEDRTGSAALAPVGSKPTLDGVYVHSNQTVMVGGPDDADRNVIGGVGLHGVEDGGISAAASHVVVDHDYIGTGLDGTTAIPNLAGVRNVGIVRNSLLSGNSDYGVQMADLVVGNLIGTTAGGDRPLPNGVGVVRARQVGGLRPAGSTTCEGPCNLISGNLSHGVAGSEIVQGNFIGTTRSGTAALPNATRPGDSLRREAITAITMLGGPSAAAEHGVCDRACNLISGNAQGGLRSSDTVVGNVIGRGIDGSPLPNDGPGVVDAYVRTVVGGDDGLGNLIADNRGPAISDVDDPVATVSGNVMIDNTGGGIVVGSAVTGTVPAVPTLAAVRTGGALTLSGSVVDLVSGSSFTSQIDVYETGVCSHHPQGRVPVGHVTIGPVTDGSWSLETHGPSSLGYVVATSTESGSTSPFTRCVRIAGATTTTPSPGDVDTVSGQGFEDGEPVKVELHSTPVTLTTVTASPTGLASATVRIPARTAAGRHRLLLVGAKSGRVVTIPITVTPAPQAGLLHLLAPSSLASVRVAAPTSVRIAGHAGVPAHGARHALVLVRSTVPLHVDGHAVPARVSTTLVLPVSRATLVAARPGLVSLTSLGWYAAARSTAGDVLRAVHPSTLRRSGTLRLAGTRGLPFVGLDGVVLTVRSRQGQTTVGGLMVGASALPETVVVRVVDGRLALHLAAGATATVVGWFGGPAVAPGGVT